MGSDKKGIKTKDEKLERVNETLSDALCLVIILENDMEIQKSDCVHARIVKMVHKILKGIQISLSEYMGWEEE